MNRKRFTHFTFCVLLTALLFSTTTFAGQGLRDFSDKAHTIKDYTGKGKWLVVMLWASDCQVCNKEAQQYVNFYEQHKNKDATVLGVSLDGQEKKAEAKDFIKRHKVSFPNLIGEPLDVATMYQELTGDNWAGTPTFMVYNPKGELIGAQVGAVPTSIIESFIARESK